VIVLLLATKMVASPKLITEELVKLDSRVHVVPYSIFSLNTIGAEIEQLLVENVRLRLSPFEFVLSQNPPLSLAMVVLADSVVFLLHKNLPLDPICMVMGSSMFVVVMLKQLVSTEAGVVTVKLEEAEFWSKNTSSEAVGTLAPLEPPLLVDHFVVLVQLPEPPTQYLFAITNTSS